MHIRVAESLHSVYPSEPYARTWTAYVVPGVRPMMATNRDLKEMARAQKFRADLYDRLNMATIRTPPLRQRLDDIPLIAEYLMNLYGPIAKRQVTGLAQEVLDLFRKYSWPGNVRELENTVRRAVFTGHSGLIRLGTCSKEV